MTGNDTRKTVAAVKSPGTRKGDDVAKDMWLSKSGAVLGRPDRLHAAYGMVIGKEQGITPSGEERAIRGLDPANAPSDER